MSAPTKVPTMRTTLRVVLNVSGEAERGESSKTYETESRVANILSRGYSSHDDDPKPSLSIEEANQRQVVSEICRLRRGKLTRKSKQSKRASRRVP